MYLRLILGILNSCDELPLVRFVRQFYIIAKKININWLEKKKNIKIKLILVV